MLTQHRLKELLRYDESSGIFTWIPKKRDYRSQYLAGGKTTNGYITIGIDNKHYLAHRLAYLYIIGSFPEKQIDHINGVRSDNRWLNLRQATPSQNNCNRVATKSVYQIVRKGRPGVWFSAHIQKDNKQYSSTFRKEEDAIVWRLRKEKELFGEFRRNTAL